MRDGDLFQFKLVIVIMILISKRINMRATVTEINPCYKNIFSPGTFANSAFFRYLSGINVIFGSTGSGTTHTSYSIGLWHLFFYNTPLIICHINTSYAATYKHLIFLISNVDLRHSTLSNPTDSIYLKKAGELIDGWINDGLILFVEQSDHLSLHQSLSLSVRSLNKPNSKPTIVIDEFQYLSRGNYSVNNGHLISDGDTKLIQNIKTIKNISLDLNCSFIICSRGWIDNDDKIHFSPDMDLHLYFSKFFHLRPLR